MQLNIDIRQSISCIEIDYIGLLSIRLYLHIIPTYFDVALWSYIIDNR